MRNLLGMSALLSLAVPVLAQAPSQGASGAVAVIQSQTAGCPVGFAARRSPDGGLISVSPGTKAHRQSYELTFTPGSEHAITQARITLHGLAGGRVLPAKDSAAGDATESFNVSPSGSHAKPFLHSTVYTSKLTGVQWVELNELTYADGSTWHESGATTCRVAPNGFMLVAGK